ncbi:MAG TPA: hypothetical protein VFB80_18555, partial [Pirellulaceae bacterium]|nr:hypothetical protein [Pirellulaceae bacterium]
HPYYQLGPRPEYPVGLVCGHFEKPPPPENGRMNRHDRRKRRLQGVHDHSASCYASAAAQDVTQWIAEHPAEHEGLKAVYPAIWRDVVRDLELAH